MNLTEALDQTLPELPVRAAKESYPRIHPKLVGREHIEEGKPVVVATVEGKGWLFRFSPENWQLVQLFNGERSYQEVSELFQQMTGIYYTPDELRGMAEGMSDSDFWYKTPQEENIALTQKLEQERRQRTKKKSKYGDVSHMVFSAWDPDEYLDKLHQKLGFIYTRWFTLLTLAAFAFMAFIFVERWSEILGDTIEFYNFAKKGLGDIAEFWLMFFVLAYFHETAHGLTCKHYGGHVHRMGFHLIYLTPAFFVELTEAWVYANRWQRILTMLAGMWTELIICAIATPIWWGTPAGTTAHDLAYKVILITGLGVLFFNLNPLIKLDGYYIFCELVGIADIKEKSTAYVSSWVQRHVWRLPVEVQYVRPRRRPLYAAYALLSGAYSYLLLFAVARFAGNVFRSYTVEWAFVPTLGVAYLIFRSRIRKLGRFMKTVYLDKKEKLRAWLQGPRGWLLAAAALLLLVLPVWQDTVEGRFVLESGKRAVVRAQVAGLVTSVYADENQPVAAGAPLVRLRNLELESQAGQAEADLRVAAARATSAQLLDAGYGPAEQQRLQLAERSRTLQQQVAKLQLSSPIAGTVVTSRLHDRVGSYLEAGQEVAEVDDLSAMQARIYVPEPEVRRLQLESPASLHFDALFGGRNGTTVAVAPVSSDMAPGLMPKPQFKGMREPQFFVATILVSNRDGRLRAGMTGTAKIYSQRRSLGGFVWQAVRDFVGRKVW